MAKSNKSFICQNCGNQHSKWQGQCHVCKEWNTIEEEIIEVQSSSNWKTLSENFISTPKNPISINKISLSKEYRLATNNFELDRVLGGGLIPGSVTLLGGEPGIGKSTLLLQISLCINTSVLYISGEESENQIKLRGNRLDGLNEKCFILNETQTQKIFKQILKIKPSLVIIDSIQTLFSEKIPNTPGSVSQIKGCSAELISFAKESSIPLILVGHITKEGSIAGPKVLEHMVDTVLQFEGDTNFAYRIIRSKKNRFGSTNEIGIFEMFNTGLKTVKNPSKLLLSNLDISLSGHAIAASIEGVRPLMIEVQALVSSAVYGTPQRSSTGFNSKRLNMILAILEKRAGFKLASKDVFLNITGGLNIEDPSIDLAVVCSILSSYHDIPLPRNICFAAEIGLSGELRSIPQLERRIGEAEKLGFKSLLTTDVDILNNEFNSIKIIQLNKLEDLISYLFS
jgi:DNA repair protein RadA/Sms